MVFGTVVIMSSKRPEFDRQTPLESSGALLGLAIDEFFSFPD